MSKGKLAVTGTALAVLMLWGAAPAAAFSLGGYGGFVKFVFSNFDAGTTGYPTAGGPFPATICSTVAGCDTVGGITPAPGAIGSEDSWGIAEVGVIEKIPGGGFAWTSGSGGEYLQAMFYGINDHRVEYLGVNTTGNNEWIAYGVGGILDVYINTLNDYDASGGPTARLTASTYPTVTDGTLFLRLAFSCCVELGDLTSTYKSKFDDATIHGSASGYLDVIGGSYASMFDTNNQFDPNGNAHDFALSTTFDATGAGSWTVVSAGQALGFVPEPSTLLLFGASLSALGALAVTRKRR